MEKGLCASNLTGTYTALITPFTQDGNNIDFDSLNSLIEAQIKAGIDGLVICGATGEGASLDEDEYLAVIQKSVEFAKGRLPIVAGISTFSTRRASEYAKAVRDLGVSGALVVSPPFVKPSQEGIIEHMRAVKKASGLPIIVYNAPTRSSVNVQPKSIQTLADEGTIVGLKESSGAWDQMLDMIGVSHKKISILSGDDSFTHSILCSGGRGVISVLSNIEPEMCLKITRAAQNADVKAGAQAQLDALELMRAMFMETNPIPVKTAAALKGLIRYPTLRLPLTPAKSETIEKLKRVLAL